jgi:hypothetical protein
MRVYMRVWCIYEGMWEIMCGGREGEREGGRGGRGGERENIPSSKPLVKHSTSKPQLLPLIDVFSVYQSSEITYLGEKSCVFAPL